MGIVRTIAISLFASAAWTYVVKPWLDGADRNRVARPHNAADALNESTYHEGWA